ncbi:endonuclease/exonuclease/phosphatase family protein [Kribbella capetownensis]|nr:endonuclease/exonuclease/phosphatase family protein [Kribbella capetownensis]
MTTRLTVATLNTRGLPLKGTRLAERFAAIAAEFDAGDIDLVCLQEVFTYYHLARLRRGMRSFPHVAYRPSVAGPAGGLVTLSRLRLTSTAYARLPRSSRHSGLPARARFNALHSGILTVRPANSRVRVLNIHPTANTDGNWSNHNRFHQLQRDQLLALAHAATADSSPAVVCGDFNVARSSTLHQELRQLSGLHDAFDGQCPPTFHADYLPQGSTAHCIDFILVAEPIDVADTALMFTDKRPLPSGPAHLSDHIGLWPTSASPPQPLTAEIPAPPPSEARHTHRGDQPHTRAKRRRTRSAATNHAAERSEGAPHRGGRPQPPSEAKAHPTAAGGHSRRAKRWREGVRVAEPPLAASGALPHK